ncbi:MAG TPA: choice-of-anchor V domain-containing protein [Terriglobia bacterium]|nr:choice-of-anchor V domain-containing protein [Terriglobia bacterium]
MQIKHTFLFTLILGLFWIGYAFAYQLGPDTGLNGVFGTSVNSNCTSCHNSFPVNSGTGGVSVTGLPAAWVPGQTYPLTVTVQPATGSRVYGFQLSAVIDGTSPLRQAGTLAKVNNAVQVICGPASGSVSTPGISCSATGALQFAEHTNANSTTTFMVNWIAPATAVGTVRFNVAGNAANGDFTNQGDRIYTQVIRVDPAAAPPPPDLSTHAFTIVDRGGQSIITDGSGDLSQGQGYARIQPNAGATTPTGVAIFGFRKNNVLISETGVLATAKLTSGRIYAEICCTAAPALNTGLAIANPNDSTANISFFFTDAAGNPAGSSTTTIGANKQIAQFLNTAPFNVYTGPTFQGTFSFTSDQPLGVVALRGLFNERNDFLMSTLPVIDTTLPPSSGTVVVPHFADGTGWTTQIFLVNPTDNAMTGSVQFTDFTGVPRTVTETVGGTTSNTFSYSIPARSSRKLATAGTSPGPQAAQGSVRVVPAVAGGAAPTALVVFSYKPGTITVAEAGVPVSSGTAFRLYVETGTNIDSGIAVANTSSSTVSVTFDVTDLNGASVGGVSPVTVSLPPSGQTAKFFSGIFPSLNSFKGVLRITTNSSGISVVGLRTRTANERGDFLVTTIPANNEANPASGNELLFPHLVNGTSPDGAYTTQFILFSGTAGQASTGNLHFVTQAGAAFNLNVN